MKIVHVYNHIPTGLQGKSPQVSILFLQMNIEWKIL